jgi:hypothetical protein
MRLSTKIPTMIQRPEGFFRIHFSSESTARLANRLKESSQLDMGDYRY